LATLQLEDLLKDELAGGDSISAWECALQALFLKLDPAALGRVCRHKLQQQLPIAVTNLEAWLSKAQEVGALRRIDPNKELPGAHAGLIKLRQAFCGPVPTVPELRSLYQSTLEQIDEEVFQFLNRQDGFYRGVAEEVELLDMEARHKLKDALHALEQGLAQVGIERSDSLRTANRAASVVTSMPFGEQCTLATLIAAVSSWKTNRSCDEARKVLRRTWLKSQRDANVTTGFMGRMLGNLDWIDEDYEMAWSELMAAVERDGDDDTILEAVRLAIQLKKWDQAKKLIQRGVDQSSLFVIRMLACRELGEIAGDVLEALAQKQSSTRQQVGLELSAWNGDMNRIRQAFKQAAVTLPLMDDLDESRKAIARQIPSSDVFQATALIFQAKSARYEAIRLASQHISYEHSEAVKALESAKNGMNQAWVERDAMIETAIAQQKWDVNNAREALKHSLAESDKNQNGCVVGFGSGCGAFLLYLMIAGFLTAQGVNAGFGTIFGWFGIAASVIPITITVMAQVAYGAQRAILDKALHDKIALAQRAYEAAAKRADTFYREKVLNLREGLGDLEARATKLEQALMVLHAEAGK
jgi:hypothetical protein